MQDKSKVILFIDEETVPVAEFMAPANFELDTWKITDGRHTLKIVSKVNGAAVATLRLRLIKLAS